MWFSTRNTFYVRIENNHPNMRSFAVELPLASSYGYAVSTFAAEHDALETGLAGLTWEDLQERIAVAWKAFHTEFAHGFRSVPVIAKTGESTPADVGRLVPPEKREQPFFHIVPDTERLGVDELRADFVEQAVNGLPEWQKEIEARIAALEPSKATDSASGVIDQIPMRSPTCVCVNLDTTPRADVARIARFLADYVQGDHAGRN